MNGYKITYIDNDGVEKVTFFGEPMSSFKVKDIKGTVLFMFSNAHPGCAVKEMISCTYEDYQSQLK